MGWSSNVWCISGVWVIMIITIPVPEPERVRLKNAVLESYFCTFAIVRVKQKP